MSNKWVKLDVLTYAINKLKLLINQKADAKHKHSSNDITLEAGTNFVSNEEKNKISKIITDGAGNAVLFDDGTYKEFAGAETIDDLSASTTSTFSSSKINSELSKKADVKDLHSHENKNVLDDISLEKFSAWEEKTKKIVTAGNGDKYLSDDGTYKTVVSSGEASGGVSSWNDLTDRPFTSIDLTSLMLEDGMLGARVRALTNYEFEVLKNHNNLDAKTIYILTDKKTIFYGDIELLANTSSEVVKFLTNLGDGSRYLADDGYYYPINNFGISDTQSTGKTTYSSEMIDEKINSIINGIILPSQNDAPSIWQKTYINVKAGDVLEMVTSESYNIDKVIVQPYKFIEGDSGVVEVIKEFDNSEKSSFFYNSEHIDFLDSDGGVMKIKDKYLISSTKNEDGYYVTDTISKSDFIDFNRITTE